MSAVRRTRNPVFDWLADHLWAHYVLAVMVVGVLAGVGLWPVLHKFFNNSLSAVPGVAFALFGFAVTAISILTSLKGSPFFLKLQTENEKLWRRLISSFVQAAVMFAVFGLLAMSISVEDTKNWSVPVLKTVIAVYWALFVCVFLFTITAVYFLQLVANSPATMAPPKPPVHNPFNQDGSE